MGQEMSELVRMSNISKVFGNSVVLDKVSLSLSRGSVHALMGENGAGKSTLMKILAGVHQPNGGEIYKNGDELRLENPKEALDRGISTVFQELSLLPNLTIAENMFLGREPITRFGKIDYTKIAQETRQALLELGLDLDPNQLVGELSIAERQFVEIAHGIKADASVFILDEPTAALNAADVEVLNNHILRLRDEGKAIVYISHRMDEIFQICDTVTVLKDGKHVATRPLKGMNKNSLIELMVGRELEDLFPERTSGTGKSVLSLNKLKLTDQAEPFSINLLQGEIVALAGLEGQGQQKLLRSFIGQFEPVSGTIEIKGKPFELPVNPESGIRDLLRRGVGFVPEDRKEEGLFLGLSIAHNIVMTLFSGLNELAIAKPHKQSVKKVVNDVKIKSNGLGSQVTTLSGGNQQKVLLGRYLAADLEVLLIEEPTRGVDVGAKSEIYKLLRDFTDNGGAIIVLSRETVELIGLCDRIYVLHADTLVAEMPATGATEHSILNAALNNGDLVETSQRTLLAMNEYRQ
jgi:ribose transport system ATP-binding protein